jgi:hypothetical protein
MRSDPFFRLINLPEHDDYILYVMRYLRELKTILEKGMYEWIQCILDLLVEMNAGPVNIHATNA